MRFKTQHRLTLILTEARGAESIEEALQKAKARAFTELVRLEEGVKVEGIDMRVVGVHEEP